MVPCSFKMMSFMSVDEVTTAGVNAFRKGKERFVPGLHNQIFYLGIVKLMPRRLLAFFSRILTRRLSDLIPRPLLDALGMSGRQRSI